MPLSFLPKGQLKLLASRQGPTIKEPEAPVFPGGENLPLGFEEVPLSFDELPPADPEWQGEELYNVNNPRLAAMLSSLPGNFCSDPTEGFYRSPKIDNTGDRPALLINGRRIHNIVVDSGAEAVITGPTGAQAMGITPDMLTPNAVALKIADGQLTKQLDCTPEPIRFTFNPGTPGELTVHSYVVIAPHDLSKTLLGTSVIGPAGLVPNSRKQRLFYYQTDAFGREISCSVAAKFLVQYGLSPLASARHAKVKAFSGSVSRGTNVPPPPKPASQPAHLASWPWIKQPVPTQGKNTIDQVHMARRHCKQTRTKLTFRSMIAPLRSRLT
jgi:hypothetical protein